MLIFGGFDCLSIFHTLRVSGRKNWKKTTALTVVVFQTFHHFFFWMMFSYPKFGERNVFKMDLFFMPQNHQPGIYYC